MLQSHRTHSQSYICSVAAALTLQELLSVVEHLYSVIAQDGATPELLSHTIALCAQVICTLWTEANESYKTHVEKLVLLSVMYREASCEILDRDGSALLGPRIRFSDYYTLHSIQFGLTVFDWDTHLTPEIAEQAIGALRKLHSLGLALHSGASFDDYSGLGPVRAVLELEYLTWRLVTRLEQYLLLRIISF